MPSFGGTTSGLLYSGGIGTRVGTAYVELVADNRGLEQGFARAEVMTRSLAGRLTTIGRGLSTVGGMLTRNLTLPIAAVGGVAVKMAADFETAMKRTNALGGVTQKQFASMRAEVLRLSAETGQAPKALADSLYFISSAGLKANQVLPVLTESARAATAQFGDAATVGQLLTTVMNNYADSGLTAAQSMDVLTAAIKLGKAEPEDMTATLGNVIPIAEQLGISFDQVGAAIAVSTNKGVEAARAITGLRYLLVHLLDPTEEAKNIYDKFGISIGGVQKMLADPGIGLLGTLRYLEDTFDMNTVKGKEAFNTIVGGVRASIVAMPLLGDNASKTTEIFNQMSSALEGTGIAFDDAFAKMKQTPEVQMQIAFNQLRLAAVDLGKTLLPAVIEAVQWVGDLAKGFAALPTATQEWIVKLLATAAVLGPIMKLLGIGYKLLGGIVGLWSKLTGAAVLQTGAVAAATTLQAGGLATGVSIEAGAAAAAATLEAGAAAAATTLATGGTAAGVGQDVSALGANLIPGVSRGSSIGLTGRAASQFVGAAQIEQFIAKETAGFAAARTGAGMTGQYFNLQAAKGFTASMGQMETAAVGATAATGSLFGTLAGSAAVIAGVVVTVGSLVQAYEDIRTSNMQLGEETGFTLDQVEKLKEQWKSSFGGGPSPWLGPFGFGLNANFTASDADKVREFGEAYNTVMQELIQQGDSAATAQQKLDQAFDQSSAQIGGWSGNVDEFRQALEYLTGVQGAVLPQLEDVTEFLAEKTHDLEPGAVISVGTLGAEAGLDVLMDRLEEAHDKGATAQDMVDTLSRSVDQGSLSWNNYLTAVTMVEEKWGQVARTFENTGQFEQLVTESATKAGSGAKNFAMLGEAAEAVGVKFTSQEVAISQWAAKVGLGEEAISALSGTMKSRVESAFARYKQDLTKTQLQQVRAAISAKNYNKALLSMYGALRKNGVELRTTLSDLKKGSAEYQQYQLSIREAAMETLTVKDSFLEWGQVLGTSKKLTAEEVRGVGLMISKFKQMGGVLNSTQSRMVSAGIKAGNYTKVIKILWRAMVRLEGPVTPEIVPPATKETLARIEEIQAAWDNMIDSLQYGGQGHRGAPGIPGGINPRTFDPPGKTGKGTSEPDEDATRAREELIKATDKSNKSEKTHQAAFGKTKKAADATARSTGIYGKALDKIPPKVDTDVTAKTDQAIKAVEAMVKKFSGIKIEIPIEAVLGGMGASVGGKAGGKTQTRHSGGEITQEGAGSIKGLRSNEVMVKAKVGEYYIQPEQAKRHKRLLDAINQGKFGRYGRHVRMSVMHHGGMLSASPSMQLTASGSQFKDVLGDSAAQQIAANPMLLATMFGGMMGGGAGAWGGFRNGFIPLSALAPIGNGYYLAPPAAGAYHAMSGAFGGPMAVVSAYRSFAQQSGLYAGRSSNPLPVAAPGTSNHGWGKALDISTGSSSWNFAMGAGRAFNWFNDVPGDPPHFDYAHRGAYIRRHGPVIAKPGEVALAPDHPDSVRALAKALQAADRRPPQSVVHMGGIHLHGFVGDADKAAEVISKRVSDKLRADNMSPMIGA